MSNIKGVMICSRPSDKPVVKSKRITDKPFITSGQNKSVLATGIKKGPDLAARNRRLQRLAMGPTANDKHKEWLTNIKVMKDRAVEEAEMYAKMKEEEKERFKKRSSVLRQLLRQGKWKETHVHGVTKKDVLAKTLTSPTKALERTMEATKESAPVTESPADVPSEKKSKPAKKLANRPGWALTKDQHEEIKEAEDDDLLNFAMGLDFQQYMEDIEVRDAVEFVKKRVSELDLKTQEIVEQEEKNQQAVEEAVQAEEAAEAAIAKAEQAKEEEDSAPVKKTVRLKTPQTAPKASSGGNGGAGEGKTKVDAAGKAMTERTIRYVHSKQSIKAVIDKERAKKMKQKSKMEIEQRWDKEENSKTSSKKTSTVNVDQHTIQNLPYLYRHPAI